LERGEREDVGDGNRGGGDAGANRGRGLGERDAELLLHCARSCNARQLCARRIGHVSEERERKVIDSPALVRSQRSVRAPRHVGRNAEGRDEWLTQAKALIHLSGERPFRSRDVVELLFDFLAFGVGRGM
jgi:hypothetical protein